MVFRLLYMSSVSACFELSGDEPYYAPSEYCVSVNGEFSGKYTANVFSVFGLSPDTEYTIGTNISDHTMTIRTKPESVCLNILDFGAKADWSDSTFAIQAAINACPSGGRVKIPAGKYITGPILLGSDITVELDENAHLLASPNPKDYPLWPGEVPDGKSDVVQISSWEGEPRVCHQSLLSAFCKKNITIIGRGIIDGNAGAGTWWDKPKEKPVGRPRILFLNSCENFVMHGVTVQNSPSWSLHPFFSKNVNFYDMHVIAPKDSPNTDGCNPENCDGVEIIGSRFSVGDDAIAVKSGKLYMGAKYKRPANAHIIRNCLVEFAHGGVVLGSEMSGGVTNLTVSQCLFRGTDRGLRIKTRRGRGKDGIIDGITFENIRMENVLTPLVINMFYFCDSDGKSDYVQQKAALPVDVGTPYIGRFTFRNMECTGCEWAAGFFYGLPEQPIESVTIDNVSFHFKENAGSGYPAMMCGIPEYSKLGLYFNNVRNVSLKNVTVDGADGQEVHLINVESAEKQ